MTATARLDQLRRAAELLVTARADLTTMPSLPEAVRPRSFDEGYRVQEMLHDLGPWSATMLKVGCTTSVTQDMLGLDEPIGGRIPAHAVFAGGVELALNRFHHVPLLECEFAMRIATDVLPDMAPPDGQAARSLVDAVAPAIELVDSRFESQLGHDGPSVVADNSMAAAVVLGEPVAWPGSAGLPELAEVSVRLSAAGPSGGEPEEIASGVGSEVLGDPWRSLAWSMAHEGRRGRTVEAGTWVITGSCAGAPAAPLDCDLSADFGPLGRIDLRVAGGRSSGREG